MGTGKEESRVGRVRDPIGHVFLHEELLDVGCVHRLNLDPPVCTADNPRRARELKENRQYYKSAHRNFL